MGFELPWLFEFNRSKVVNGSLWTLPFEFLCYIFLFIFLSFYKYIIKSTTLSALGKFSISFFLVYFITYLLSLHILAERAEFLFWGVRERLNASANNPIFLYGFFSLGAFAYFLKGKIIIARKIFLIIICIQILSNFFEVPIVNFLSETLTIIYGIFIFSSEKIFWKFNSSIDPSYGVYLYAWPIQNMIASFWNFSAYQSLIVTLPITLIIGVLSNIYIENPMQRVRNSFFKSLYR